MFLVIEHLVKLVIIVVRPAVPVVIIVVRLLTICFHFGKRFGEIERRFALTDDLIARISVPSQSFVVHIVVERVGDDEFHRGKFAREFEDHRRHVLLEILDRSDNPVGIRLLFVEALRVVSDGEFDKVGA